MYQLAELLPLVVGGVGLELAPLQRVVAALQEVYQLAELLPLVVVGVGLKLAPLVFFRLLSAHLMFLPPVCVAVIRNAELPFQSNRTSFDVASPLSQRLDLQTRLYSLLHEFLLVDPQGDHVALFFFPLQLKGAFFLVGFPWQYPLVSDLCVILV